MWHGETYGELALPLPTSTGQPSLMQKILMIYFIQEDVSGPIKIGHTDKALQTRLNTLQANNPHNLTCIAMLDGTRVIERALHARFQLFRIRGEWFKPEPELMQYIAEHTTRFPALLPRS